MATIRTITIILENGVSEEYVEERLIPAIKLFAGVLGATSEAVNADDKWALDNAKWELRRQILEVLK